MFKKLMSMATATLMLAAAISIAAVPASNATAVDFDCSTLTTGQVVYYSMAGTSADVTLSANCARFYFPSALLGISNGLTLTAVTNTSIDSNGYATPTASGIWTVHVAGSPIAGGNTTSGMVYILLPGSGIAKVAFVSPSLYTNANLNYLSIMGATLSPTFSGTTYSYTATLSGTNLSASAVPIANKLGVDSTLNARVTAACDGSSMTMTVSSTPGQYGGTCTLTANATKNVTVTVTALDGSSTQTYTIAVTTTSGGGGGGGGGGGMMPTGTATVVSDTSITFDFSDIQAAHSSVALWHANIYSMDSSHALLQSHNVSSAPFRYTFTGLTAGTQYAMVAADPALGLSIFGTEQGYAASVRATTTNTGGGSSGGSAPSSPDAAAAAAAARAAAEAARVAAIAKARSGLVDIIKVQKPASIDDYKAADFNVKSQATVDRINKDVLALQAKTPTVPLTTDAIKAVVAKEGFVDQISTPDTQGTVLPKDLVKAGVIDSASKYKTSVLIGLQKLSPDQLNTYEKVQAAVAAQLAIAQARADRLAAGKARLAKRLANR